MSSVFGWHPAHEEVHDVDDILAHWVGQRLRGERLVVAMGGQVRYQRPYAVCLVSFIPDPPGVMLGATSLCMRAGPVLARGTCLNTLMADMMQDSQ